MWVRTRIGGARERPRKACALLCYVQALVPVRLASTFATGQAIGQALKQDTGHAMPHGPYIVAHPLAGALWHVLCPIACGLVVDLIWAACLVPSL